MLQVRLRGGCHELLVLHVRLRGDLHGALVLRSLRLRGSCQVVVAAMVQAGALRLRGGCQEALLPLHLYGGCRRMRLSSFQVLVLLLQQGSRHPQALQLLLALSMSMLPAPVGCGHVG